MSINQLDNCPQCGSLFVKGVRDICPACHEQVEEQFRTVNKYLREQNNRKATIHEVSKNTGVSVKQIRTFIREGRLTLENFPNLGYPCRRCGDMIREGEYCLRCRTQLHEQVQQFMSDEEKSQQQTRYQVKDKGYRKYSDHEQD